MKIMCNRQAITDCKFLIYLDVRYNSKKAARLTSVNSSA
jgi:hypothetical protein